MKTTKAMTTERETDETLLQWCQDFMEGWPEDSSTYKICAELKRRIAADAKLESQQGSSNDGIQQPSCMPEPVGKPKQYAPVVSGLHEHVMHVRVQMEEYPDGGFVKYEELPKAMSTVSSDMRARVPDINKKKLCEKFTEIVALRLDVFEQRIDGVWPPDTDLDRWRNRYIGRRHDELPPFTIELNHFKNEVDQFVAMLMFAIDDAAASKPDRDSVSRDTKE